MRYVVLTLLSLFMGFSGFLGSVFVAVMLGISLHDNYEYFSPSYGEGTARFIGTVLCYGGGIVGAVLPWSFFWLWRKP